MTATGQRPRRICLALGLLTFALLASGCVYLRLLQLKRQLAEFDANFRLSTTAGLRLDFLNPLLSTNDIRWLGFEPSSRQRLGLAERWHLRWLKELPEGVTEPRTYDIAFDLIFTEEKLSGLNIAETYFALVPKSLVVAGIKSLGGATINKKDRHVAATVDASGIKEPIVWPSQRTIIEQLGQPTGEHTADGLRIVRYRFVGVREPTAKPNERPNEIDLRLTFDIARDELLKTEGRTPIGNIDWAFKPVPGAK